MNTLKQPSIIYIWTRTRTFSRRDPPSLCALSDNFTYGMSHEACWAGLVRNPFVDESIGCHADYNLVSRNITHMKLNARSFLRQLEPSAPFFLYVGFGDVHRCREGGPAGAFCEKFGAPGWPAGAIADWKPQVYSQS